MTKKILSVVLLVAVLTASVCAFAAPEAVPVEEVPAEEVPVEEVPVEEVPVEETPAQPQQNEYVTIKQQLEQMGALDDEKEQKLQIKSVSYDGKGKLLVTIENKSDLNLEGSFVIEGDENTKIAFTSDTTNIKGKPISTEDRMHVVNFTIPADETIVIEEKIVSKSKTPVLNLCIQYVEYNTQPMGLDNVYTIYKEDIVKNASKASGGSFVMVMSKVGRYILNNILAVISLIISLFVLAYVILKGKKDSMQTAQGKGCNQKPSLKDDTQTKE